jgi:ribokinase
MAGRRGIRRRHAGTFDRRDLGRPRRGRRSPDGAWTVAAPQVEAVDTTGAGDAATGALAAMLAEGGSLPDAVRVAVAAGAIAVQARGTVDSYAAREDVLALAERMVIG